MRVLDGEELDSCRGASRRRSPRRGGRRGILVTYTPYQKMPSKYIGSCSLRGVLQPFALIIVFTTSSYLVSLVCGVFSLDFRERKGGKERHGGVSSSSWHEFSIFDFASARVFSAPKFRLLSYSISYSFTAFETNEKLRLD
jgi:hypothetical protein